MRTILQNILAAYVQFLFCLFNEINILNKKTRTELVLTLNIDDLSNTTTK